MKQSEEMPSWFRYLGLTVFYTVIPALTLAAATFWLRGALFVVRWAWQVGR